MVLSQKLHEAFKGTVERITGPRTVSAFKEKGVLSVTEFVVAGDNLVSKCPTWSWWLISHRFYLFLTSCILLSTIASKYYFNFCFFLQLYWTILSFLIFFCHVWIICLDRYTISFYFGIHQSVLIKAVV